MPVTMNENDLVKKLGTNAWLVGLLLTALGALGVVLPVVLSTITSWFVGWLLLFAGVLFSYYSYQDYSHSFIGWWKPLILFITAFLFIFEPAAGVATLTLLVSFYLFTDAFGSFALSYDRYPLPSWGWMSLNGVFSLLLAIILLIGWPQASAIYLGIFIGISLMFDGFALFMLGIAIKKP